MNPSQERFAIDTCISAIQDYFSCAANSPIDHACLCERHIWHVACYDNYASNPISRRDRDMAEEYMRYVCDAAGDMSTASVQHRYHQQRRQINSILNSVGGVVNSFLSSQSIGLAIPTAIPSLPAAPLAQTTSQPTSAASSARNTSPTPTALSSTASPTTFVPSQSSTPSATSSSTSSTISPGVIAGAVIGGVAVLILLAILIMLILRHKSKKRTPPGPTYYPATLEDGSRRSLDKTLVDRTPMVEPRVPVGGYMGNEKDVYRSSQQNVHNVVSPGHSEMETNANVWEIDGRERERERPMPSELESPVVERGSLWSDGRERRRDPRSELHF